MKRWLSGERSALNGVTTGASTPRIRWVMVSSALIPKHETSEIPIHSFAFFSLSFALLIGGIWNSFPARDEQKQEALPQSSRSTR
jgi:hypothetical protein